MIPALFLDRDGTITRELDFLTETDQLQILEGATSGIKMANEVGLPVVVITNQSGIARGYLTEDDLEYVHDFLKNELSKDRATIDAIYYCPHHPAAPLVRYRKKCKCRKPEPGLLVRAARELGLDLAQSIMIGDRLRDVEAGQRAGCLGVLVRTGYGLRDLELNSPITPDFVADNLQRAIEWALEQYETTPSEEL